MQAHSADFRDTPAASALALRRPRATDGAAVNDLVARCHPLDENSVYCNLVQCSHFAGTSVAAEMDGQLVGFVSGHLLPDRPEALFIWQVAVDEVARGQGLAKKMLAHILNRPGLHKVREVHTTITRDNVASQRLFTSLAKYLGAKFSITEHFEGGQHFDGRHDSEFLWRIGPFRWSQRLDARVGQVA